MSSLLRVSDVVSIDTNPSRVLPSPSLRARSYHFASRVFFLFLFLLASSTPSSLSFCAPGICSRASPSCSSPPPCCARLRLFAPPTPAPVDVPLLSPSSPLLFAPCPPSQARTTAGSDRFRRLGPPYQIRTDAAPTKAPQGRCAPLNDSSFRGVDGALYFF